ncbi:hypothetical protein ABTX81_22970 [Kitasatospora sp. NPDC097605]|uniref:hypothetical protein n=1 Tax=Kitasatospora sp. NPDC097605 TaxID=3157226 RepID=UPI00332D6348
MVTRPRTALERERAAHEPDGERPVGGYLTVMAAYLGGVGALAALAHRSGRALPRAVARQHHRDVVGGTGRGGGRHGGASPGSGVCGSAVCGWTAVGYVVAGALSPPARTAVPNGHASMSR